jgi:3-hydroxyacyl-CoA dehydrogenase
VYETMEVKKEIFTKLDAIAKPGAILASNTSYLDIDAIAACTQRPEDVVGMHFFSPANVMKLLEVVRGDKTADDVLATVMALAKKIKKVAVVAGVTYGFIGNRMLMPRQVEATKLLLEGASPEQIDKVHVAFGMPMGPFQMRWRRRTAGARRPRRGSTITTRSGRRRTRHGSPRSSTISARSRV